MLSYYTQIIGACNDKLVRKYHSYLTGSFVISFELFSGKRIRSSKAKYKSIIQCSLNIICIYITAPFLTQQKRIITVTAVYKITLMQPVQCDQNVSDTVTYNSSQYDRCNKPRIPLQNHLQQQIFHSLQLICSGPTTL